MQVVPDGSLKGLDELEPQIDKEHRDVGAILVAQLIGLLLTFIGEGLTLRLVQDEGVRPLHRILLARRVPGSPYSLAPSRDDTAR